MTERQVQNELYMTLFRDHKLLAVPCSGALGWEADFLIVTRALVVHEFEIKLSRSDFLVDKKKDKWAHFEALRRGESKIVRQATWGKYDLPAALPPNYFWYVCPEGMIKAEEVPSWAGLFYVSEPEEETWARTIQRPKKLHSEKIAPARLRTLCSAVNYRWWNLRLQGLDKGVSIDGGKEQ